MIRWTARHPVVPVALVGLFLCLGSAALWRMPVDYLLGTPPAPLYAGFDVPGRPGRETVLDRVVEPFERRLEGEPGVAHCRSWIAPDGAGVEIELDHGVNAELAAARLREIAAAVAHAGPADTASVVWRARPESERPGLVVQLSGVARTAVEEELLPRLGRLSGLRSVELYPPGERSLLLGVSDPRAGVEWAVREAVRRALGRNPLGRLGSRAVLSPAPPVTLPELLQATATVDDHSVPLGDLVQTGRPWQEIGTVYRVDGREGLFLIVSDDPSLPRRSVLKTARRTIEEWAASRQASVVVVWDRWAEVLDALGGLAAAALSGLALAVIALGFALRRARAVLLMAAAVPLSLLLAVILLAVLGRGLDVVAIGALAVALGLQVDAAVVVGEALAGRNESDPRERAAAGVREAAGPLVLGGVTTLVALAPVWLGLGHTLDSLEGASLPLAAGIVASILVACTVIPGLAASLERMPRLGRPRYVSRAVKAAVRDPLVVSLGVLAPTAAILLVLSPRLPTGDRVSGGDPRDVEISLEQPAGADRAAFAELLQPVEASVSRVHGVERVLSVLSGDRAWLFLRLAPGHGAGRSREKTIARVVELLGERSLHRATWRLEGEPAAGGQQAGEPDPGRLAVTVIGDELAAVDETAFRLHAVAGAPSPLVGHSRQQVVVRARQPGLDLGQVLAPPDRRALPALLDGRPVAVTVAGFGERQGGKPRALSAWLDAPGPSGVPPVELVTHRLAAEAQWPERRDGAFLRELSLPVTQRMMSLARLKQERATLRQRLQRLPLPAGVALTLEEVEPRRPLPAWLLPALVASCGLLLALGIGFESLLAPLRVTAVLVPHLAGAVLALWLLQVRVSEAVVFGCLLLLGTAVSSGVLLEDRYLALRRRGHPQRSAVVRAGVERAPTVLLTVTTSALALAPLWFGGVDQLGRPLAAVLAGGLLLGTPATLLLLPALEALGAPRRKRRPIVWLGEGSDRLRLRSLTKSYGSLRALRGVTADLEPGMIGLLGPNGAGKTTLIRCLVGALEADAGDVWVNGVPRRDDPAGWRALVGYLPQAQSVPLTQEAGQWLELWAGELGLTDPGAAARAVLASLGLSELSGRRLGELSGGQRRRIRVARALLGEPKVLVVDEPTTGLDPEARVDLRNLLAELARERVVLLSTHIPEDIAIACHRVLVMVDGRLRFDGSVDSLLERARGHVRQRTVADAELRTVAREHRVVSRVRRPEGIRIRYLCDDADDPGRPVEPSLEEAYLWLLGDRAPRHLSTSAIFRLPPVAHR